MGTGVRHVDRYKTELLLINQSSAALTLWVDMALYSHVTFFVGAANSTGTPAATITAYQASTTGGGGSKVLSINNYFYCTGGFASQSSAQDSMAQSSSGITGGSFAIASTLSTNLLYAVEVQDTDLDLTSAGPFKCVALSLSAISSTNVSIWAHCFPRFDGNFAELPSALT